MCTKVTQTDQQLQSSKETQTIQIQGKSIVSPIIILAMLSLHTKIEPVKIFSNQAEKPRS